MMNVFLDVSAKTHSLYNELLNYPPLGYTFVNEKTNIDIAFNKISKVQWTSNFTALVNKLIPINIVIPYISKYREFDTKIDLFYSPGHVVYKKIPWVVDLEFVTHLTAYDMKLFNLYKKKIQKSFESTCCKKIMPWTDAGKKSVLLNIDYKNFEDKIETVNLAVHAKKFTKQYNDNKVKILFVGSINLPFDFHVKGGKEVFECFKILTTKYENLELTMRSWVPENIRNKYSRMSNIKIIDEIIPWNRLEFEFMSSDIFLFPSHNTPGMVILDAMSYELPVVTTDVWGNPEMVKNGVTGYAVEKSKKLNYYSENYIPLWGTKEFKYSIRNFVDPSVVQELVTKTSILIEDSNKRRKMGKLARQEIESGKFSIEKRNYKLKQIFDEALDYD